jgi:hypothetical protein
MTSRNAWSRSAIVRRIFALIKVGSTRKRSNCVVMFAQSYAGLPWLLSPMKGWLVEVCVYTLHLRETGGEMS